MPYCGGQPLADFVSEVADSRNGGVRLEQPGQVADVADAAGGAEAGCEVECLAADVGGLLGFALADVRFPVHSADEYSYLLSATYRRLVPAGIVPAFGTEHMDLTWDNVTTPRFCILDMEHWGVAVTGYAAAWLYLSALTVPAVANRVRDALTDVLDTPSGRYAQLVAAALILRSLTRLPDPAGLAARLHQHTDTLLG